MPPLHTGRLKCPELVWNFVEKCLEPNLDLEPLTTVEPPRNLSKTGPSETFLQPLTFLELSTALSETPPVLQFLEVPIQPSEPWSPSGTFGIISWNLLEPSETLSLPCLGRVLALASGSICLAAALRGWPSLTSSEICLGSKQNAVAWMVPFLCCFSYAQDAVTVK